MIIETLSNYGKLFFFKPLGNFSKRWFLSRNISSISNPNVICAGMPKDFKLYKEILFSPSMHPKFHPNRSTRIWGDNIFNVWFLISCLTSWSWVGVKNCVPSYWAHQTTGVCEISGKNMNRKSDFHLRSKSFGIPAYSLKFIGLFLG